MSRAALTVWLALFTAGPLLAQPTYKLDVKSDLQPRATLKLAGLKITRSGLSDDPGFRLQFHFQKDGKTIATVNARTAETVDLPSTEAGVYTVALELFYPNYKGGNVQKGEFRAVSSTLVYRLEKGNPPPLVLLPPLHSPALSMMFGTLYPLKP
jgi:hypothetical protein